MDGLGRGWAAEGLPAIQGVESKIKRGRECLRGASK